jgi:hypothetical protein
MFWKKSKETDMKMPEQERHPYRFCHLYISETYKQILFVPFGKTSSPIYAELDSIIIDKWPCDFGNLQQNIVATLNKFSNTLEYKFGNLSSYNNSKAKSQQSFENDFIRFRIETDKSRPYTAHEAERIKVSATPTILDDTYQLIGCDHLIDTKIAQIVIDIFSACIKIRY